MFGQQMLDSRGLSATRQGVQGSVAFAQRDHFRFADFLRQDFSKAPDAALIQRKRRTAALQPEVDKNRWPGRFSPMRINNLQQIAAGWTAKGGSGLHGG